MAALQGPAGTEVNPDDLGNFQDVRYIVEY